MKFSRFTWRIIGLIVLLGFTAFFFVPVIWVLLATTKTDTQLTSAGPFAFGAFGHVAAAWRALFGFQSDAMLGCLLYTSPSPRDGATSRMPSSA